MVFAQKLDLLMTITRTTNRELGEYLVIDPSQVSRVRNGRRRPGGCFLEGLKLCLFFAERLKDDYQKKAVQNALGLPYVLPDDLEEAASILAGVMRLRDFSEPVIPEPIPEHPHATVGTSRFGVEIPVQVYTGTEGNNAAKVHFLEEVLKESIPRTICLFNNDDMVWMKDDTPFAHTINRLAREMYARGHRHIAIFTPERNFSQLSSMVDEWMPQILSQSLKVFYYPGKVDGIFRRHISIMSGGLALTTSAVGDMSEDKMTMITRDKQIIRSLQKEFDQLLYLSKPLFNVYQSSNEKQMLQDITNISKDEAPTFRYADPLPGNTMPESVFNSAYERMEYRFKERVARHYHEIYRYNEWNLNRVPTMEMIHLPDPADVKTGRIPVEQSLYFPMETIYYTPQEYADHLRHILFLLEKHPFYHLALTEREGPENHLLLIKKGTHVLVSNKNYPPVILTSREPLIVDIFWHHYVEKSGLDKITTVQKRRVMNILEQYLADLTR